MTRIHFIGLGALCLSFLNGCQTSPSAAFPTAQSLAGGKNGRGQAVSTLEAGRKIYTTSCTECHVARPVANYSVAQWRHYVGIMAPRAGLSPQDRAALEAYLVTARESSPPR